MLEEEKITAEGRQVRCASCHHVWRYLPDEVASLRPLPFLSFPPGESLVDGRSFSKKPVSWVKWSLLICFLALVAACIFCRSFVVTLWPASQHGYALLGLSARLAGEGLTISNTTSLVHREGDTDMIVVAGDLINTSDCVRPVPVLKIILKGKEGEGDQSQEGPILDHWEHHLAEHSLLPGEKLHFEAAPRPRIEGAHHVFIEF